MNQEQTQQFVDDVADEVAMLVREGLSESRDDYIKMLMRVGVMLTESRGIVAESKHVADEIEEAWRRGA